MIQKISLDILQCKFRYIRFYKVSLDILQCKFRYIKIYDSKNKFRYFTM